MKTNEMFPSKYFKADPDLLDKKRQPLDLPVTITSIEVETFNQDDGSEDTKYVLYFDETPKGLILNKTNYNILMGLYPASDTDQWISERVTLYAKEVDFRGNTTWGTRIRLSPPGEVEYTDLE